MFKEPDDRVPSFGYGAPQKQTRRMPPVLLIALLSLAGWAVIYGVAYLLFELFQQMPDVSAGVDFWKSLLEPPIFFTLL